jgi:Tfp pilus assembly protein PilO
MNRRAPIIAAVLAVLLSVGFYFLLWQPKDEELEEVREETAQLESRRGQLQNEVRRLEEIAEREVEYRAALAKLEEYIPTGPAQSTVIREFQTTADAAGVSIESVTFSEPVVVDPELPTGTADTVLASVTVSMNVEGGYFQVVDFFRRLEVDVPRAVLMQQVGLDEGEGGYPVLANNWSGLLYTVIPDPEVVGAPPPAPDAEVDPDADPDADVEVDVDVDEDAEDDVDVDIEIQAREEEQS